MFCHSCLLWHKISLFSDTSKDENAAGECPDGWNLLRYECFTSVGSSMIREAAQRHCDGLYPGASLYTAHARVQINWPDYGVSPGSEFWLGMQKNDGKHNYAVLTP